MGPQLDRRSLLKLAAALALPGATLAAPASGAATDAPGCVEPRYLPVTAAQVPAPRTISFRVAGGEGRPITLYGHYWYPAEALASGTRLPAILELNPYRRRDGTLYGDSKMYPWFAANGYLCFRVDLPGSGDSEGVLTDEYSAVELAACVEVIRQIAALPICDGNVGMMGKSWSAINSLMVAARDDCPEALKAIIVCCGSDDRFDDDVHYMGGAMMMDNAAWPSSMWGWLALPPDPAVVGEGWREQWRARIRAADFWFRQWATHQTRDAYWAETSVRDHYDRVKVPVFVLSGWEDGYKNTAERCTRSLGALGKPVAGLIGPWGHKYPFDGYPGPRIDWLRYIVTHWWDRWLKGARPDPASTWPEMVVWLGRSRAAGRVPGVEDDGTWVAEDHDWPSRMRERAFHLWPDATLRDQGGAPHQVLPVPADVVVGTAQLETSSWGDCRNGDLPADTGPDDSHSLRFDGQPLAEDLACFGYPRLSLNLRCDKPLGAIAVRLSEVAPDGSAHLVVYGLFNLCDAAGDLAAPRPVPSDAFTMAVTLPVLGHVFRRGWRLRLSIAPFSFPALWASPEAPALQLATGRLGDGPESALLLPERPPRPEDAGVQALLGPAATTYCDPELYLRPERSERDGATTRIVEAATIDGRPGLRVRKRFDNGDTVFGGMLDNLRFDQVLEEISEVVAGDPLSATFVGRNRTVLSRGDWSVRSSTSTRIWSERTPDGGFAFRYEASVETFVGDEPFEQKAVSGTIPRRWV
ncbi:MAG: CocE/NonD family hydrolase [Dongiaceae bacterium]